MVEARFHSIQGRELQSTRLKEGEAQYCDAKQSRVVPISINRTKFESLRIDTAGERYQRWLAYSRRLRNDPALVAYYTFEKSDRPPAVLPNVSAAGSALDGQVDNAEWVEGRMPGKLALHFYGPGSNGKVVLPDQKRFNFTGPFSVAVWFKVERFAGAWQALVTKGDDTWRLQQYANNDCISFDTGADHDQCEATQAQSSVVDGRWHLAVAVLMPIDDAVRKTIYLDGHVGGGGWMTGAIEPEQRAGVVGGDQHHTRPRVPGHDRRGGNLPACVIVEGSCGNVSDWQAVRRLCRGDESGKEVMGDRRQ